MKEPDPRNTDPREDVLDQLMTDAGWCANCCIAGVDGPHEDCAGPEGYWCDCPCTDSEEA